MNASLHTLPTPKTQPKNSPSRRTKEELRAEAQQARAQARASQAALQAALELADAARLEADAAKSQASEPEATPSTYRRAMTLAVGVAIPAGYLGVAQVGATAYQAGVTWLAALAAVFAFGLVTVSLPHGVRALRDITGTSARAAWALAAVIDGLLVVAEAARVTVADSLGLGLVCACLIAGVSVFSAVFNVHAFRLGGAR